MKSFWHNFFHIVATGAQIANAAGVFTAVVPAKYQPLVAAGVAAIQGVVATKVPTTPGTVITTKK